MRNSLPIYLFNQIHDDIEIKSKNTNFQIFCYLFYFIYSLKFQKPILSKNGLDFLMDFDGMNSCKFTWRQHFIITHSFLKTLGQWSIAERVLYLRTAVDHIQLRYAFRSGSIW